MLSRARGCRTLSLHLPHTICVPRATFTSIGDQPLIHKLDLRVGRIVKVEPHPQAEHLYVEQVDLGEKSEENVEQTRTIVSGLVKYVSMRDMLASINNKQVVVVRNMKPSKFRGILSQGMLLAASKEGRVELLEPAAGSIIGERVQVDGLADLDTADEVLKPKQRVMEQIAEDLITNDQCVATWKNMALKTNAGWVKCNTIHNGTIS